MIGVWCNGSTEDFGSSSTSSNLVIPTKTYNIMNKNIDDAAKQYANKWDVDNGIKKLIIEAYKQGAKYIINNNIKK